MKLSADIITDKLKGTKALEQNVLNFWIGFEIDFYLLMNAPDQQTQLAFLLADHPSLHRLFQTTFEGKGPFLTIKLNDVNSECAQLRSLKSLPV